MRVIKTKFTLDWTSTPVPTTYRGFFVTKRYNRRVSIIT